MSEPSSLTPDEPTTAMPPVDVEPEFRATTRSIFEQWQAGSLEYERAVERLLQHQHEAQGKPANQAAVENYLGIMQAMRGNYVESIQHFQQSRTLYETAGATQRLPGCDLNIGESFRIIGNYSRARTYFHHAYEEAKAIGSIATQAIAQGNEGQMLLSMRNVRLARQNLEAALELCHQPWHDQGDEESPQQRSSRLGATCEMYSALVTVFILDRKYPKAWDYAHKAYRLAEQLDVLPLIGTANRAMGDVLTAMRMSPDPDFVYDPDHYYQVALNAFRRVNADGDVGKTLLAQGRSMAKRGRRRTAGQLYQQAMVIFTKLGMHADAARAAEAQMENV